MCAEYKIILKINSFSKTNAKQIHKILEEVIVKYVDYSFNKKMNVKIYLLDNRSFYEKVKTFFTILFSKSSFKYEDVSGTTFDILRVNITHYCKTYMCNVQHSLLPGFVIRFTGSKYENNQIVNQFDKSAIIYSAIINKTVKDKAITKEMLGVL